MRTIVVVLPEAEAQLDELARTDRQLAQVARAYIARLRLQPDLGQPVERGQLRSLDARRIRFGHDDQPGRLFGEHRGHVRRGDQDLAAGPPMRIVYTSREAPQAQTRLLLVASVGRGHTAPGETNAYDDALAVLKRIAKER